MSLSDSCIAETLSDLNMFYIRQIGASLKKVTSNNIKWLVIGRTVCVFLRS